jgi:hypothetical protein
MKEVIFGIAVLAAIIVVVYALTFMNVATAPARVIDKTMETNNIIHSYEWFYDMRASYLSRVNQLNEYSRLPRSPDPSEAARERMELSAIRQTCRELVTKYNADSEKINKSLFKGWSLPDYLDIQTCE